MRPHEKGRREVLMSTDTIESEVTEAPVTTEAAPLTDAENDAVIRTAAEQEKVAKVGNSTAPESRAWGQQAQVD